jgi:hypothetical protein
LLFYLIGYVNRAFVTVVIRFISSRKKLTSDLHCHDIPLVGIGVPARGQFRETARSNTPACG